MPQPPSDQSDEWLVKMVMLAQARDQEAFAALFERYNSEICRFLSRLVDDKEEVHNLANDTFFKAWLNLPKLHDVSRFRAWLYTIATNRVRDYLRRCRIIRWLPWDHLEKSDASRIMLMGGHEEHVAETDLVQLALRQVPWKFRTCLLMQANDFSQDEIAEAMEISKTSVSTYVSKGRRLFLQVYRQMEDKRNNIEKRRSAQ